MHCLHKALPQLLLAAALTSSAACNKLPGLQPGKARHTGRTQPAGEDQLSGLAASCGVTRSPAGLHRLNNSEYDLTVRDLLGTAKTPARAFPADNTAAGFDTAAAALSITPTLAQNYLAAARDLAAEYVAGPGKSALSCGGTAASPASCVGSALAQITARAYRRPLLADEQTRLDAFVQSLLSGGTAPEDALRSGVTAVLLSPQFLFRADLGAAAAGGSQTAMAERLAYFLWSSMPDAELQQLASTGKLSGPTVAAQVTRMLDDPRAAAFSLNFGSQWLGTRQMVQAATAEQRDLYSDFAQETLLFLGEFFGSNLHVKDLLTARFTYVNGRLAKFYGMPAAAAASPSTGAATATPASGTSDFARATVSDEHRGGLLTQGAFLVQTSNPETTSPVKRGKWVLENILCDAPPPPPPSVEAGEFASIDPSLPMRERVKLHSSTPGCAGCHTTMDPVGLAFESFDAKGLWRAADATGAIDASGTLPDGRAFANSTGLTALLRDDAAYPRCVITKMATYGLGREPTPQETCVIEALAARTDDPAYGLKSMLRDLTLALFAY